jgi:hypothetical protein
MTNDAPSRKSKEKEKEEKTTKEKGKKSHIVCHFDGTYFYGSMRPNIVTPLKPYACHIGASVKIWTKWLVKQKCF